MCVVIPDCTSCKNFKGKNKNGLFYCSAFPQGIPKKIFLGKYTCEKYIRMCK